MLKLSFGLEFADLHQREGLTRLDAQFLHFVAASDPALRDALLAARAAPEALAPKAESELLIALAPQLDDFVARLFGIEAEARALAGQHHELAPLYQREAPVRAAPGAAQVQARGRRGPRCGTADGRRRCWASRSPSWPSRGRSRQWQEDEAANAGQLELARPLRRVGGAHRGRARAPPRRRAVQGAAQARFPEPGAADHARRRSGFPRHTLDAPAPARGLRAHRSRHRPHRRAGRGQLLHLVPRAGQGFLLARAAREGAQGRGSASAPFKKSPFGVTLAGCPLEEKISEFHMVKTRGEAIAALAIIVVDNPMVAATGHRICNDCMKSCIYQKQEPVNIPQAETRTLKDVLELPWGFEIYALLTRWNPLQPAPAAAAARHGTQGAGGRPGAGRLHAGASPDERRPHRGRHRRPEDRAAAAELAGVDRRQARRLRAGARRAHADANRWTSA